MESSNSEAMATNLTGRAELEVREVQAMLRQAAMSFKASLSLFLTIALLFTACKAGVRFGVRSDLIMRWRQSPSNSSLSRASHSQPNAAGLMKRGTENSMLADILTSKQENSSRLEAIGSNAEDSVGSDGAPPFVKGDVDVVIAKEGCHSGEKTQGKLFHDTKDTDEPKPVKSGSAQDDWVVSKEETQENEKQIYGGSISNELRSFEASGNPSASERSLEVYREIGYTDPSGDDIARQHDEHSVPSAESFHEQLEEKDWVLDDVEYADEDTLFNNMFDMEDTDGNAGLPPLQIVMVSNQTGKSAREDIEIVYGLTYFTGGLWGEQRVDRDAMDNDGVASLLVAFVTVASLVAVFVVVMIPHAMVKGLVAYSVVSTHMGKRVSRRQAALAGLKSGIKRLIWLSFLRASWQYLQARILKEALFGGILGLEQVDQLSSRQSSLPVSILALLRGEIATDFTMAVRIGLFLGLNQVCTSMAYCIFVVGCWILVMERDHKVFGAIKRSCHLIRGMISQALVIQLVEAVMCGSTFHRLLQQAIGQLSADFVMSVTKLYFLVLWFIFYLSARSLNDQPSHFSYRTLEDFLEQYN